MEYTELELLAQANAILELITSKINLDSDLVSNGMKNIKVTILAAQHKLDLLREQLGGG